MISWFIEQRKNTHHSRNHRSSILYHSPITISPQSRHISSLSFAFPTLISVVYCDACLLSEMISVRDSVGSAIANFLPPVLSLTVQTRACLHLTIGYHEWAGTVVFTRQGISTSGRGGKKRYFLRSLFYLCWWASFCSWKRGFQVREPCNAIAPIRLMFSIWPSFFIIMIHFRVLKYQCMSIQHFAFDSIQTPFQYILTFTTPHPLKYPYNFCFIHKTFIIISIHHAGRSSSRLPERCHWSTDSSIDPDANAGFIFVTIAAVSWAFPSGLGGGRGRRGVWRAGSSTVLITSFSRVDHY